MSAKQILIRKEPDLEPFPWFFVVEHSPRRAYPIDSGSVATQEMAMRYAWHILCRYEMTRDVDWG
jgi:hypothetical protein